MPDLQMSFIRQTRDLEVNIQTGLADRVIRSIQTLQDTLDKLTDEYRHDERLSFEDKFRLEVERAAKSVVKLALVEASEPIQQATLSLDDPDLINEQ